MRKTSLFIILLFLFTSVSCGNKENSDSSSSSTDSTVNTDSSSSSSETTDIKPAPVITNTSIYNLDFSGSDFGKNAVSESKFADATKVGDNIVRSEKKHKEKNVIEFKNTSHMSSYLSLPGEVLDKDELTIALWVKLPEDLATFNNNAPLFSIVYEDGYFAPSPYDTGTWFSYSMNSKLPGEEAKNLTLAEPSDQCAWQNTPLSGTLQSPAGAWQLVGFSFTKDALYVYQNGREMLSFDGDYSLKGKNITEFLIGSSSVSTAKDYNAFISDFRVYDKVLDKGEYVSEFGLISSDFLTADYEFNGNGKESVRSFDATLAGTASYTTKDGRGVVYLDGNNPGVASERSSLTLPKQIFSGHNEITISTDIYLINSMDRYQRIFEFSTGGGRYFALFVGFSDTNDLKLEFTPSAESNRHVVIKTGYTVPTEKWINITVTANKEKGVIYVDGVPVATTEDYEYDPVINYYFPDVVSTIGRTQFYNDNPLSAYIDNFKMYSIALDEKEIMQMNNVITIEDDKAAVDKVASEYKIVQKHDALLQFDDYAAEGVKLSYVSGNPDIIDSNGKIYQDTIDHDVVVEVTFTRGEYSVKKDYTVHVKAFTEVSRRLEDTDLNSVTYDSESYYDKTMMSNLDYLFTLDVERLLYNYRLNAGLDTKGYEGYGGWISTSCGGAGQFETQYIGALARYTLTKPDYVSSSSPEYVNTPFKRLYYMLTEIRKCQVAYGNKYPEQKGYLSAFTHLCMEAIKKGTSSVDQGDGIHGTVPVGGVNAWVPFYMYHKNLMMCYDVYQYVDDSDCKALALQMLTDASDWAYNAVIDLTDTERSNVLGFEYGGMTEVMYLTYKITKNANYLKVAKFFEQESLLDNLYNNVNCLKGIHSNTTVPKILGAAAAYEVTGNEYYKVICENFWRMVSSDMSYANGGFSIDEHFETPGVTSQGCYGEETCCSYNFMMLTDYLYRWTGKAMYFDYFENLFYNHIMSSIDPATGGKTYPTSTAFGYHKIYSADIDAFWCCCCTGQETFSKLVYGNYHLSDEKVYVQMYNPTTLSLEDKSISISGDLLTDEKVHLTVSKEDAYQLRLRKPSWTTPTITINGKEYAYRSDDGYMVLDETLKPTDNIIISLPMQIYMKEQKGVSNSYALFYGPMMLVADLGIQEGDTYSSTNQTGTYQSNGTFLSYDGGYSGSISQINVMENFNLKDISTRIVKTVEDGKLKFTLTADNQTVTFIPYIDCIYNRFSMYMYYFDQDALDTFSFEGEKHDIATSSSSGWSTYKERSSNICAFHTAGLSLKGGEQKIINNNVELSGNYEAGFTVSGTGSVYGGLYLGASNPHNELDGIKALNVNVERDPGSTSWRIMIYQFNQSYLGCVGSATVVSGDTLSIRAVVKDGHLYVFANDDTAPRINIAISSSWTNGHIGIRNQGSSTATYSNLYYKQ